MCLEASERNNNGDDILTGRLSKAVSFDKRIVHIDAIDAIRGWAILAVIALHVATATPPAAFLMPIAHEGGRGVQLFFIASALTLAMSHYQRIGEPRQLGSYFIRRLFRIVPLYYSAAIFWICWSNAGLPASGNVDTSSVAITSTFLFANGFHPTLINSIVPGGWSVVVEMNFYLLLPIVFCYVTDLRSAIKMGLGNGAVGLAAGIAGYYLAPYFWQGNDLVDARGLYAAFWLPISLPAFMAGLVVYFVYRDNAWPWASSKKALGAACLTMLVLCYAPVPLKNILFIPPLSVFVLALLKEAPKLFVNRFTEYIGKISFSAYFVHFGMIELAVAYVPGEFQKFAYLLPLTIAMTVIGSLLTYNGIEEPGRRIGRRVIKWFQQRKVCVG